MRDSKERLRKKGDKTFVELLQRVVGELEVAPGFANLHYAR